MIKVNKIMNGLQKEEEICFLHSLSDCGGTGR